MLRTSSVIATAFALLAASLLLLMPERATAETFTVTKTNDTADGTCNADCSLREAVIAANADSDDDVIVLPPGTHSLSIGGAGEEAAATGDLDVTQGLEIRGAGAGSGGTVVSASGLGDRILDQIGFAEIGVQDLTLRGGTATSGGAIQAIDEVTIRRSRFEGNTASDDGGAIYSSADASRITIEDSTFSGNTADRGGAIFNQAAATIVAQGVTFAGNISADRGGAIYNQNEAAFTLTDSSLANNQAVDDGGAVFTQNSTDFTAMRSTLTGNRAGSAGGAIYVQNDSALSIIETTIAGNTAAGVADFDGGGAIYMNNDSAVLINRSTISGNRSEGDAGGLSRNNDGQLLMQNSTVSGNSAAGDGGGLIFDGLGGSSLIDLESTTVTGNTAGGLGGGIYNEGEPELPAVLLRTIVAGNTAAGAPSDCATDGIANFDSAGFNLDGTGTCGLVAGGDIGGGNAALGPLAVNGGPTQTHALLLGSAAIDAGGPACRPIDQRSVVRPQGGACDIGSYEAIPDVTAPELELKAKKKQRVGKLQVKVSCDEACTATASGKVKVKGKKAFKLAPATAEIAAGETKTLKLKAKGKKGPKKLKAAVKRAKKGKATIAITATDSSGNESRDKLAVEVKP